MQSGQNIVSHILLGQVAKWLTQSALVGEDLETIVRGFCERLAAAGLPVCRIHLSFSMLHPLYDALGFTWRRSGGMTIEGYRHVAEDKQELFLQSPYYYLLDHNLQHMRRILTPEAPNEFPIFEDLKKEGVTDYFAFVQPFSGNSVQGMMGSWSTDSLTGFSDDMIEALLSLQNHLAVAAKMAVLSKLANNMLTTYLGADAGKRVLNGQVRRGDGETIRAALVIGDMRQSSFYAEKEGRQAYIDMLNQFFDAIATPFNSNGGAILSFLGDGFLAVYPCGRHKEPSKVACRAALAAAYQAQARMTELNRSRAEDGRPAIRFGMGLHVGNVMFGNVGLRDRLTFSAFGSAVNEVQRLQVLTKKYDSEIVGSHAFASYCGGHWTELGEEKLRGIRQKLTILKPDPQRTLALNENRPLDLLEDGLSEAEQVILLHRDKRRSTTAVKQLNL
ncbi:adenylate/guanylate cyclase domain-containing protein [Oryzifoliimicrobium ureilyticus]|uniref:adenylate/guanylate cyclase domain-containing protein n=1 Tax=Oryzifoliimicrobium ureilyticus TaxID=3113724 RepID=UPI003075EE4A